MPHEILLDVVESGGLYDEDRGFAASWTPRRWVHGDEAMEVSGPRWGAWHYVHDHDADTFRQQRGCSHGESQCGVGIGLVIRADEENRRTHTPARESVDHIDFDPIREPGRRVE